MPSMHTILCAQQKEKGKLLMHQQVIKESEVPEPGPAAGDDHTSGASHDNPTLVKQVDSLQNGRVPSDADTSTGSEAVISDVKGMNFDVQVGLQQSASGMTSLSMPEKDALNGTLVDVLPKWKSLDIKQVWAIADMKRQEFLGFSEFVTAMQVVPSKSSTKFNHK